VAEDGRSLGRNQGSHTDIFPPCEGHTVCGTTGIRELEKCPVPGEMFTSSAGRATRETLATVPYSNAETTEAVVEALG
jgi:hypothetical protein